jgi:hypothetical protein
LGNEGAMQKKEEYGYTTARKYLRPIINEINKAFKRLGWDDRASLSRFENGKTYYGLVTRRFKTSMRIRLVVIPSSDEGYTFHVYRFKRHDEEGGLTWVFDDEPLEIQDAFDVWFKGYMLHVDNYVELVSDIIIERLTPPEEKTLVPTGVTGERLGSIRLK